MMFRPARLLALLAAAVVSFAASFAVCGAGQAEQREARLPKGPLSERPAISASCNEAQFKTCTDAAARYCEVFPLGAADKNKCWQDRQQQCKTQYGC